MRTWIAAVSVVVGVAAGPARAADVEPSPPSPAERSTRSPAANALLGVGVGLVVGGGAMAGGAIGVAWTERPGGEGEQYTMIALEISGWMLAGTGAIFIVGGEVGRARGFIGVAPAPGGVQVVGRW